MLYILILKNILAPEDGVSTLGNKSKQLSLQYKYAGICKTHERKEPLKPF